MLVAKAFVSNFRQAIVSHDLDDVARVETVPRLISVKFGFGLLVTEKEGGGGYQTYFFQCIRIQSQISSTPSFPI